MHISNCYRHKKLDEASPYLIFGIFCALDDAQQMVEDEFSGIPGVLAVHIDIIISGANRDEHATALEKVLKRAK